MNLREYQEQASRTARKDEQSAMLKNGALGLVGEVGELADPVKKARYHGHDMDRDKMVRELGDVLWYVSYMCSALSVPLQSLHPVSIRAVQTSLDAEVLRLACVVGRVVDCIDRPRSLTMMIYLKDLMFGLFRVAEALGVTMSDVAEVNIKKLQARYPDGFSEERSKNRGPDE